MTFVMLSPEINSGRMYAGPGAGPMLAAAAAWDGLAAELHSSAASYESAVSGLASWPWRGPASAAMRAAAAPYVAWMRATAAQAEQSASQAKEAAAAYETAFAMTVPPTVIAANRSLVMTLVATNILGQNTPAITATEADYAEMWAQDATAMYGYAGSSAAASTLTPFTSPPPTVNPAGVGGQAATVTQAIMSNGPQVISALPQVLQGLASSPAAASPLSSAAGLLAGNGSSALLTALTALVLPLTAVDIPIAATSATASFTSASTTYRGFLINADRDFAQGKGPFTGYGPGAAMVPQWLVGGPNALVEASSVAAPVAAGVGQTTTVGGLSVPSAWASAAPAFRPVAYALPMAGAEGATDILAGSSGDLFGAMALAGLVGRTARPGRGDQRVRLTGKPAALPPRPRAEAATDIAAELCELAARAQSLLAKLADSGLMTKDEVIEQTRRFRG